MKIILLGYMASGKSTIGKRLSMARNIPYIDLDSYIVEQEGMTITDIFTKEGEVYFRRQEHNYLKQLLEYQDDFVLALGGGTPCYANNIELINSVENTCSIYLKATILTLFDRLVQEQETRPLVSNLTPEALREFIAKHLFERSFFYEQAKYRIHIDYKTIQEIIDDLQQLCLH